MSPDDAKPTPETGHNSDSLENFPFYEEGKVPQYHKYHAEISYLDELEIIWGKKWGAQGIGRLREVAMGQADGDRGEEALRASLLFLVFNGITPDLGLMQEQHLALAETYRSLGIEVHYVSWADDPPRSAYGPLKRSISAAAGFVVNGGAIIPREATPVLAGAIALCVEIPDEHRLPDSLHRPRPWCLRDRCLDAA